MGHLEMVYKFIQEHPAVYHCIVLVAACCICAVADFFVKNVLLRGMKQIFSRLSDSDEAGQNLINDAILKSSPALKSVPKTAPMEE